MDLYEAWLSTVRDHSNEKAIVDTASGQHWTFDQIQSEQEELGTGSEPIVYPQGQQPGFIFELLAAWRNGKMTCPLEAGQTKIHFAQFPKNCAHLKLTSASSGSSKCVAFTAAQLAADTLNIVSTMELSREWPNLAVISMAHSYGFSNLILPLILHGIPLIIAPAPLPEIVLAASRHFPGITLPAVPALWRTWTSSNAIPKNIRIAISAGAPLPCELEREIFEKHNLKVHNFYGSSECGGIAYDRSATPREDSSYVGTAMENVQLSLNTRGALVAQSAAVGETYWPTPQSNLERGRFETSDLAEIEKGKVRLRGRASDVINVAGRKIAPEVIEEALRSHPSVLECIVFGITGPEQRFETIAACVNTSAEISELAKYLSTKLPAWQIPRSWWFTAELKPNARGKLSRHEWRKLFLSRSAP
jgi:long-chain acyl-CoA synthetase